MMNKTSLRCKLCFFFLNQIISMDKHCLLLLLEEKQAKEPFGKLFISSICIVYNMILLWNCYL